MVGRSSSRDGIRSAYIKIELNMHCLPYTLRSRSRWIVLRLAHARCVPVERATYRILKKNWCDLLQWVNCQLNASDMKLPSTLPRLTNTNILLVTPCVEAVPQCGTHIRIQEAIEQRYEKSLQNESVVFSCVSLLSINLLLLWYGLWDQHSRSHNLAPTRKNFMLPHQMCCKCIWN